MLRTVLILATTLMLALVTAVPVSGHTSCAGFGAEAAALAQTGTLGTFASGIATSEPMAASTAVHEFQSAFCSP